MDDVFWMCLTELSVNEVKGAEVRLGAWRFEYTACTDGCELRKDGGIL